MKLVGVSRRDPSRTLTERVLSGTENVAGVYDEIVHGHPDAMKGYLDMRVRFAQTTVCVEPVADETVEEQHFRERCQRVVDSMIYDLRASTDIADAVEHLADAIVFGAAVYEVTWTRDALGFPVVNLSPVPLQNISRWEVVRGRPVPVVMVDNKPIQIPSDRLIHIVPLAGAGPAGIGILRPLVFPYELWKQTLEDMGIRAGKEAGGVMVHATTPIVDDAQVASVLRDAAAFAAGDNVAWVIPDGYQASIADLPPASSRLDVVEYCDQKIRTMFDDALSSLVSSDKGSRALGDAVAEDANDDEAQTIEYLISRFGRYLFAHVALAYEYEGRLPAMTSEPEERSDGPALVGERRGAAELTGWYEADRDDLRARLGMTPVEEAGRELSIGVESSLMMSRHRAEDAPDIVDTPGLIAGRNADEERLREEIGRIADRLRAAAVGYMSDGVLSGNERSALEREYMGPLNTAILAYADRRREKAYAWGERLRDRATSAGLVETTTVNEKTLGKGLAEALLRSAERVDIMASAQARTIFQRVVGEVEEQYTSRGGDLGDEAPETRITDKGLAEGAAGVGHAAEQSGRLEGAAEAAKDTGLVLLGAWRASFEDSSRCSVCRGKSQTFYEVDALPDLPDPECLGGVARCRCGLVPVFGRPKGGAR